jgi:hypothetical protein
VSLADHYETANDSLVKRTCKTCEWYQTLAPADQAFFDEKVEESLAERGQMQRLRRAVISAGLPVSRSTFHGHVHEHHLDLSRRVREERKQR